jgi:hypothetical protein
VVTSENIHRYDPNFQPQPPQPPPAAVISPTTTPIAPNLTASAHTAATRSGCQNASNQGKVGGEHVGEQVAYGPALHWDREPIRFGLGAKYAAYSWRQTTTEVEVRVRCSNFCVCRLLSSRMLSDSTVGLVSAACTEKLRHNQ